MPAVRPDFAPGPPIDRLPISPTEAAAYSAWRAADVGYRTAWKGHLWRLAHGNPSDPEHDYYWNEWDAWSGGWATARRYRKPEPWALEPAQADPDGLAHMGVLGIPMIWAWLELRTRWLQWEYYVPDHRDRQQILRDRKASVVGWDWIDGTIRSPHSGGLRYIRQGWGGRPVLSWERWAFDQRLPGSVMYRPSGQSFVVPLEDGWLPSTAHPRPGFH